ncbi:MAG: hypothetical protein ABIZ72_09140, partial [Candidatus Limnocylindrales bacterium]
RGGGDGSRSADLARVAVGCGLIAVATYLPLVIHELGSAGSEVRSAVEFFGAGGESSAVALPGRLLIVAARVLSWPLTGLITTAPTAALVSTAVVLALGTTLSIGRPGRLDRVDAIARVDVTTMSRWLMLGLGWIILGLAVGSASLAIVVPGLANDDYHAFADPMILVVVAVGLVTMVDRVANRDPQRILSRFAAAIVVVALVTWNLANQPPGRAPDGGWAAAQAAAGRVIRVAGSSPLVLSSLPTFKGDEALRMPLEAAGAELAPAGPNGPAFGGPTANRIVLCDQLFRGSIGADCGGPAEDAWLRSPESGNVGSGLARLVDRFETAPGRWISVYAP